MTATREAMVLPLLLLTATLLAGLRPGAPATVVAPSLYALVLATLLIAALVRSGALDPARLLHGSRSILANANGAVVLVALLTSAAAVLSMVLPESGLPRFFVAAFLLALLINTLVAQPDRIRLLRSLAVILGSGLIVKFVILASLSDGSNTTARVLIALFDAATFGSIAQEPQSPVAGYLAFAASALFLGGAALLPGARAVREAASDMQRLEA